MRSILKEMTREEKFRLLTGTGSNTSYEISRLGIRQMRFHDSPFGVRMKAAQTQRKETARKAFSAFPNADKGEEVVSTAFPAGCALGATWDKELLYRVGRALGEEFRAYGINAVMGPAVNLKRHPLCGRNFEYLSEDPVLSGELGAAYVEGVQSAGVAATPKHFIANNQEKGRFTTSSEMDERTMRELYLKPFERIVARAKPWAMMCAYNRINGVYASEHRQLLREILREEWGFDGIVISDWGAVKNRAFSLLASVELCMPYQQEAYGQLENAYREGLIDDGAVDEAVERLLAFLERTKAVYEPHEIDFEGHDELAVQAACEAITLLKNERDVLPLQPGGCGRVLVIGERAVRPFIGGDGSSRVKNPPVVREPLAELKRCLGKGAEVEFLDEGCLKTYENEIGYMENALYEKASKADAVVVFLGQDYSQSSETMDRNHMEIEPYQEHVLRVCRRASQRVIAVLNIGSAVTVSHWEKYADAILVSWMGGQGMGAAVARALTGAINPAGRLAETFPKRQQDVLSLQTYPGDGLKIEYREGLMVGYRHFDTNHVEPAYEFGFGLSYTRFAYRNLTRDGLKLRFELENTGKRDGEEVVQVYVSAPKQSWVTHPEKELKAFERVFLKAGETVQLEILLKEEDFCYYNVALQRWISEEGAYTVRIGSSSRNLPLSCGIERKTDALITTSYAPE